jgi:hypothetical protein
MDSTAKELIEEKNDAMQTVQDWLVAANL